MKIWQVGAAPNPFRVDGVSRTVWLLSLEQARCGMEVALILNGTPTPEAEQMAADAGLTLHDVTAGPFSYTKQLRELVATTPPDVVHMHSVFIPRQAAMANVLRERRIPYIITPHAGLAPQVLARGRLKKGIYSALRERPRFMGSAAVALVTPAEEKAVRAYLPDYRGIIRWMPNPVDFSKLDPHRWEGLGDHKRLVFLGRFDVLVKGIDILLEIARLLPDVKVDLYGTEDPKTRDWLMKLKRNLPENVTFHDPVYDAAKAQELSRASLYIQPSRWEGFPVSVAECMYLGVPSSITETLDLAELVTRERLGLVLSLTPDVAASQVRKALEDAPQMQRWSERGREFAIRHFAPQAVAENHLRLYEDVLEQSRREAAAAHIHSNGDGNGQIHGAQTSRNGAVRSGGANAHPPRRRIIPQQLRGSLKQNVSRFVERGSELLGTGPGARSIVLCYHSIHELDHGLTIAPEVFRSQLNALRSMGYEFQTFGDFVYRVMRWGMPKNNVAVITFDDGFEDNYTTAAPILSDLNIPATFFITSGLLERDEKITADFQKLTSFQTGYLSARQLMELHANGFEIAAHTHTHRNLARLPSLEVRQEIERSKQAVEEAIAAPVRSFAYPFGKRHIHYTPHTVELVRETGYRGAAAVAFRAVTSRQAVRIFEIPRFFITRGDSANQFRQKVAGHFDWVGTFQELSPRWLKALVSPEERY